MSSSTPSTQVLSSKSKYNLVSEAPGVQAIPYPQQSTPVIDLTASSSTSGNQGAEVPINIKPKSPSPTKDKLLFCPDLIPISSDDEPSVPKLQECSSTNLEASGLPTRDVSGLVSLISSPESHLAGKSRQLSTAAQSDIPWMSSKLLCLLPQLLFRRTGEFVLPWLTKSQIFKWGSPGLFYSMSQRVSAENIPVFRAWVHWIIPCVVQISKTLLLFKLF